MNVTDNKYDPLTKLFPVTDHTLHLTELLEEQCELLESIQKQLINNNKNLAIIAQAIIKYVEGQNKVVNPVPANIKLKKGK